MTLREILQISTSPISEEFERAITAADNLHHCSPIPPVPVILNRSRTEEGAYHSRSRPNRALRIEISRHASWPALTLLHEVGHMLDHLALNPIKHGFGSEHDPLFEPLRIAWRRSRAGRKMQSFLTGRHRLGTGTIRQYFLYQAREREVWARTYAQWVTTCSGDFHLKSQLRASRELGMKHGLLTDYYWEDDDFEDIIKCVDEVLRQAGLK